MPRAPRAVPLVGCSEEEDDDPALPPYSGATGGSSASKGRAEAALRSKVERLQEENDDLSDKLNKVRGMGGGGGGGTDRGHPCRARRVWWCGGGGSAGCLWGRAYPGLPRPSVGCLEAWMLVLELSCKLLRAAVFAVAGRGLGPRVGSLEGGRWGYYRRAGTSPPPCCV
jgi:hypothetical protein